MNAYSRRKKYVRYQKIRYDKLRAKQKPNVSKPSFWGGLSVYFHRPRRVFLFPKRPLSSRRSGTLRRKLSVFSSFRAKSVYEMDTLKYLSFTK